MKTEEDIKEALSFAQSLDSSTSVKKTIKAKNYRAGFIVALKLVLED